MMNIAMKLKDVLWKESVINPDSARKTRGVTLPTKGHIVTAMVFPVVMHRCKSWTERRLSTEELIFLNGGAGEDP